MCEALLEPTSSLLSFGGILWSLRVPIVCYSLAQGGSTGLPPLQPRIPQCPSVTCGMRLKARGGEKVTLEGPVTQPSRQLTPPGPLSTPGPLQWPRPTGTSRISCGNSGKRSDFSNRTNTSSHSNAGKPSCAMQVAFPITGPWVPPFRKNLPGAFPRCSGKPCRTAADF